MASGEATTIPAKDEGQARSNVPIEMSNMAGSPGEQGVNPSTSEHNKDDTTAKDIENVLHQSRVQSSQETAPSGSNPNLPATDSATSATPLPPEPQTTLPHPLTREPTGPAIGPATDKPTPFPREPEAEGPVLFITLLLTTGARHPFRLDQKYLKKRNVEVEGDNPVNMSLYKLKELILRDWRDDWEAKPSSPDSIRLISMGKLLTDKQKLSEFGFKDGAAPTIVHMTIKPQDLIDDEEGNKTSRERESSERTPRCRCLVM